VHTRHLRKRTGIAVGELDLSRLPGRHAKIATYDVKFEKNTEVYKLDEIGARGESRRKKRQAPFRYCAPRVSRSKVRDLWPHRICAWRQTAMCT